MDRTEFYEDISIHSRLENIKGTFTEKEARRMVDFLAEYCFRDEMVYTDGTILVPMFRVLDAIAMHGRSYLYCETLPEPYTRSTSTINLPLSAGLTKALIQDGKLSLGSILSMPVKYFRRVRGIGRERYSELVSFLNQFKTNQDEKIFHKV